MELWNGHTEKMKHATIRPAMPFGQQVKIVGNRNQMSRGAVTMGVHSWGFRLLHSSMRDHLPLAEIRELGQRARRSIWLPLQAKEQEAAVTVIAWGRELERWHGELVVLVHVRFFEKYTADYVNPEFFYVELDISAKCRWIWAYYTSFLRSQYPLKLTFNTYQATGQDSILKNQLKGTQESHTRMFTV